MRPVIYFCALILCGGAGIAAVSGAYGWAVFGALLSVLFIADELITAIREKP